MVTDLFYGLLPEHLLLALLVVLMSIEIIGRGGRLAGGLFVLVAVSGCVILLNQLGQNYSAVVVPGEISVDNFALVSRIVVLACGAVFGISCLENNESPKFWMMICSSLLGASIMMVSSGFISLFLGIELLSLPAFALMVHRAGSSVASEAAFKYLLLSAVASATILFGISLSYGSINSLVIHDFTLALSGGNALGLAASILVLCGFFLKAAVFPFHGWAPDAYGGARLQVTTVLASIVKAAVVLALVRVLGEEPLNGYMSSMVMVLGIASILYGNLTAINQTTFKRLLAYSSIAHAGYMIFALVDTTGSRTDDLLYYVAVYALTTIVACACFAILVPNGSDELFDLSGAFARRPLPAVVLALAALSMAGIPPLPGFFAKLFVFKSVIASGQTWPSVLAFSGSFIGVTYYLGLVARIFKPQGEPAVTEGLLKSTWALGGVLLGVLLLIVVSVAPQPFLF